MSYPAWVVRGRPHNPAAVRQLYARARHPCDGPSSGSRKVMTRIVSVDVFVRGVTIPNCSMSALTLNHGNGKFIVHEYYVFGNFYPWGRALLRSLQRRSCTLLWTEFSSAARCHEPQCARPVVARSYGSSRSLTAPQGARRAAGRQQQHWFRLEDYLEIQAGQV